MGLVGSGPTMEGGPDEHQNRYVFGIPEAYRRDGAEETDGVTMT